MSITENTPARLVLSLRQQSFFYLGLAFAAFGLLLAGVGLASGQTPLPWAIGLSLGGILAGALMLGIERHTRITLDQSAGALQVETRQFRRTTTFRAPLAKVSDAVIETHKQGRRTLHALRFLGPDGTPLDFIRYLEPDREITEHVATMHSWLAEYHGDAPD